MLFQHCSGSSVCSWLLYVTVFRLAFDQRALAQDTVCMEHGDPMTLDPAVTMHVCPRNPSITSLIDNATKRRSHLIFHSVCMDLGERCWAKVPRTDGKKVRVDNTPKTILSAIVEVKAVGEDAVNTIVQHGLDEPLVIQNEHIGVH